MGRGIWRHGPALAPAVPRRCGSSASGEGAVRAAAPCGCGRRRASALPHVAFCGDDAPAREPGVRLCGLATGSVRSAEGGASAPRAAPRPGRLLLRLTRPSVQGEMLPARGREARCLGPCPQQAPLRKPGRDDRRALTARPIGVGGGGRPGRRVVRRAPPMGPIGPIGHMGGGRARGPGRSCRSYASNRSYAMRRGAMPRSSCAPRERGQEPFPARRPGRPPEGGTPNRFRAVWSPAFTRNRLRQCHSCQEPSPGDRWDRWDIWEGAGRAARAVLSVLCVP